MSGTCSTDRDHGEDEQREQRLADNLARIKHRWLVLSGKGGVGKSTVAVNLACALVRRGSRVGLLDVDIHGPNVAKMLGIEERRLGNGRRGMEPVKLLRGLKVVSMASLMPDPGEAVIWRGPRKMGAIRQFLADVDWGDLDHMVVDAPPGTGDEPLSVAQLMGEADGAIIVTTPQEMSLLDCRKCVDFARQVGLPVAGIIENMSGLICPHCQGGIDLFGTGGGQSMAHELGVPYLGRIPLDPEVVTSGDQGRPFTHFDHEGATAREFEAIVDRVLESMRPESPAAVELEQTQPTGDESMTLIAIASEDSRGMDGTVSAHFGRCPYYTLVEVEDGAVVRHRVENNPHVGQHRPGQMPRLIHSMGAEVILAGGMGPRAVDMFHGFGMDVATGVTGQVRQAVEAYLQGTLRGTVPCQHDHPDSCGGHADGQTCEDVHPAGDKSKVGQESGGARVAVPALDDAGLEAMVDPRFGRAPYFVILDVKAGEVLNVLPNTAAGAAHGAGTGAARIMADNQVNAVIAGRFGPKALQALQASGVEQWMVPDGLTVAQTLEKLRAGELSRVR